MTDSARPSLVRALGTVGLAAGIVNVTIGGGIFRLPAAVAGSLGTAAPVAYVICAVAMGLIVLCIAEAGSRVSLTGGPYAYVEVAFGPFAGFLGGVLLWSIGTFALAAVATIFADAMGALAPALAGATARAVFLVAMLAALAAVNVRGVRQGALLVNVATAAKLVPLILLVVVGAFAVRAENLAITETPSGAAIARTSILLIFAFAGIESALVPSGEVKDPARTVPRAIFIAMIVITLLYLSLHVVTQGILGPELPGQATPLAEAAGRGLGGWGRTALLVGAAISMFGYVSGMTLAIPRVLYAFARDGFLPARLAAVHPRFLTPHVAIVVQTVLVAVLAVTSGFEQLAILANLGILLLYAMCCLAAVQLRRRDVQAGGTPFRVPAAGIVPYVACAVIVWLLSSITWQEWAVTLGVLAAGALVFLATRRHRARAGIVAEQDEQRSGA